MPRECLSQLQRRLLTLITGLMLALASVALAGTVRCTTYHEAALNRWHTICADGTRGLSTYNRTLDRWDTTLSPPPGKAGQGHPKPPPGARHGR